MKLRTLIVFLVFWFFPKSALGQESTTTDSYNSTLAFFAGTHVGTEVVLKTIKKFSGEYEINGYNRVITSLVMGIISYSASSVASNQGGALAGATAGIVTGNLLQVEW